ncbi:MULTISPECIES: YhcH/YjgK/YiaL family protein [Bacillaceae]|uniref:YhcH/YjgK/YiaL family protein n=1 Tax=Peribacillus huizhouensis TaxID=1501239 RepID=A0ABR6CTV8_9BACI|nr:MULTISPECIES: YhcH/YjgK/YiaL family protein [Bacillaceae]MBA9028454.1 YhcH/YjgK/YiaL family protein [Peribacillus huizhouensis]
MIVDHITNYDLYKGSNERIDKAFAFIKSMNFDELIPKTYEVEGEELFFNVLEYETTNVENRFWESHKKYIDIHYLLEGTEFIGYEQFERMRIKENYNEENDYFLLEGSLHSKVRLQQGDFMICYPEDVHMTGIKVDEQEKVRKLVFKVKI